MLRPFKRHQQKVRALQSGAAAVTGDARPVLAEPKPDSEAGREYAALRVLLHEDIRKLSDIASIEARNPVKAEMARQYAGWIDGVLTAGEQGQAAQDEILVTNMIWAIDYRDFDYALALAAHALKYNLTLPERYNRTVACFVAEEVATIAHENHELVTLDQLMRVMALTYLADMPDPARAKLHKEIGRAFERRAEDFDPAADNAPAGGKSAYMHEALQHLQRALTLYRDIGVKKDIERVARQLKNLQKDAEPAPDA